MPMCPSYLFFPGRPLSLVLRIVKALTTVFSDNHPERRIDKLRGKQLVRDPVVRLFLGCLDHSRAEATLGISPMEVFRTTIASLRRGLNRCDIVRSAGTTPMDP